jgi:hypothetical protein
MKNNSRAIGRFKDAGWISKDAPNIMILGMGGIGSNTFYNLYRSIPAHYRVIDFDTVEEHNTGTQFFSKHSIGELKIESVKLLSESFSNCILSLEAECQKVRDGFVASAITITGFDNMEARKAAFEAWMKIEDREVFIDGRLRATSYDVYFVKKGDESRYLETLFDDNDLTSDVCTFKQTSHFGMLIGARITMLLTNYLVNKYCGEEINQTPFKFSELGDACYVDIQY